MEAYSYNGLQALKAYNRALDAVEDQEASNLLAQLTSYGMVEKVAPRASVAVVEAAPVAPVAPVRGSILKSTRASRRASKLMPASPKPRARKMGNTIQYVYESKNVRCFNATMTKAVKAILRLSRRKNNAAYNEMKQVVDEIRNRYKPLFMMSTKWEGLRTACRPTCDMNGSYVAGENEWTANLVEYEQELHQLCLYIDEHYP
jgi:hypothetical protein